MVGRTDAQAKRSVVMHAITISIAASLTFGSAQAADAAPHHHNHKHRSSHASKHRARKADLSGDELELVVERTHTLTPDEELGNRAAVEAAECPGPAPTPLEEETAMEPEP